MDGSMSEVSEEEPFFDVGGDRILPDQLGEGLARSLIDFVSGHGGHTASVEELRRIDGNIDVVVLNMTTCISQEPKFEVLPEERLAVMFINDEPAVVPLRKDFPLTPHSYGLPLGSVLPGSMTICLDDRPWEDAKADYSGAEIIRRVISWFGRVDTGAVDDAFQLPHTIFLPAEQTIVMSSKLQAEFCDPANPSVFLRLKSLGESDKYLVAEADEITDTNDPTGNAVGAFVGFTLGVRAQNSGAMWHRPQHLGHLRYMLAGGQEDLLDLLRRRLNQILSNPGPDVERLYQFRLLFQFVVFNDAHDSVEPMFLGTEASLGEIGVATGLLFKTPRGVGHSYGRCLPIGNIDEAMVEGIRLMSANLSFCFEGEVASIYAGHDEEWRAGIGKSVAMLGAGSIGSQCITTLVREGAFEKLTIVDDDIFAPHNLARHVLRGPASGNSKTAMLSDDLSAIRADLCIETICEKISTTQPSEKLNEALATSDRILDFTASLGASRTLSAISRRSRATSAFFNPSGSSVVVLQEDASKTLDLATLEALYYAEICHNKSLYDHLRPGDQAVVSGGQCRAVTSRIPASRAAILSSIAASELAKILSSRDPSITIASINADGGTSMHRSIPTIGKMSLDAAGWKICLAGVVAQRLQNLREAHLPSETGGILLGVVDHAQKRIEISMGLEAPPDSSGSPSSFERGVQGTIDSIAEARARTMHQLTYIGEWHSHPRGAQTAPSLTDGAQLVLLREELLAEQRPPVMVIVGDSGPTPISLEVNQ